MPKVVNRSLRSGLPPSLWLVCLPVLAALTCACDGSAAGERTVTISSLPSWERRIEGTELDDLIRKSVDQFDKSERDFAECLKSNGLQYELRKVSVSVANPGRGLLTRAESARTFGYGIVDGEGSAGVVATISGGAVSDADLPAFRVLTESGGPCALKVNVKDPQVDIAEARGTMPELSAELLTSEAFLASRGRWRECMKSRGFAYETPSSAFFALEAEFVSITAADDESATKIKRLFEKEVAVATADADCFEAEIQPVVERNIST